MPGISASKIAIPFNSVGFDESAYWTTRTPIDLYAVVYRNTEADLAWIDASGGEVPFRVYISTDGINYVEKGTTVAGDTTYTATGLTAGTLYYFYVKAYNGTNESPATNIIDTYFKITVDTTKAGSADTHFILPVTAKSAASYFVDWGEGGAEEEFTTTGNKDHTYAASGTYQVKVRGGLTAIAFNNGGDKLKLMSIDNWGIIAWSSMANAYYGCANMTGTYTDNPNTAAVINMTFLFAQCVNFNSSVAGFNTGNVMYMSNMFYNCTVFNQSVANFNTVKVTTFATMFYRAYAFNQSVANFNTATASNLYAMFIQCTAFKQSLETFSLAAATNVNDMCQGCDINAAGTTTNYDATLVAWAAADVPNSLLFKGGTSKYGEVLVDNGTTDGAAANKLIQSGQNFITTVTIGDVVYNTTDGTYAFVTGIDSDTQLAISADIMASGEVYRIQHGAGAKARASLIIDDLWTITDGGF